VRAIRRFTVRPVLPEVLQPLRSLALNLRWSWHAETRELFASCDPEVWEHTGGDPIRMLSELDPDRLERLAADRRFVRGVELAEADLQQYLAEPRWYQGWAEETAGAPKAIAYFSPEFGVSEVLPQYSGGLGILAGDHLKAASDLGVPIIGVGLLYRAGYFRQALDASGWQQERYPVLDPHEMPLTLLSKGEEPVRIQVPLGTRTFFAQVWVAQVGRVPLLMLDSDVEGNAAADRGITDRLYGGGPEHRLAQEVLLGIGGVRAVRAYCRITGHPQPEVFHTNEGHAGFLGLERIAELMAGTDDQPGDDFDTALARTRAGTVFTTHTPVPAGIDRFDRGLVEHQFSHFAGLPLDRVLALGAEDFEGGDPGKFNMAVMGLRLGQRANGVSQLHGEVSREMFHGLWPDFDTDEVPIGSITNGVHADTWVHPDLLGLLATDTADGFDFSAVHRTDPATLWDLKRQMRRELVTMVRRRLRDSTEHRGLPSEWVDSVLDPDILTFGFARRVPSYKRLTLMLRDRDRLRALLTHPEHPIQIVIAGKSHPADEGGKRLIQEMVRFADAEDVRHRIVFLPDYDIAMARPLYPGCDVWLNNPLRPYEACGTSGMKAALNGAANLSIRDGWWDEWYEPEFGWAIPSAEGIEDPDRRDDLEAKALYDIIENEIVPRFYDTDADGLPRQWLAMVTATITGLGPKVLATRMVRDYVTGLYEPAAAASRRVNDDPTWVRDRVAWQQRVMAGWHQVSVEHVDASAAGELHVGQVVGISTVVRLGSLSPGDVTVQLVAGRVNGDDQLHEVSITNAVQHEDLGEGRHRYTGEVPVQRAGSLGFTARVVPRVTEGDPATELALAALPAEAAHPSA